jgi:hypothetical protein
VGEVGSLVHTAIGIAQIVSQNLVHKVLQKFVRTTMYRTTLSK